MVLIFFFFQAEDGIRDYKVTGVQTCALPIWVQSILPVEGICFFDWKDALHPVVQYYNFRNRRSTIVYEFPERTNVHDTGGTAFSVSPDGRWIVYTQVDQAGSNLVLVENFR